MHIYILKVLKFEFKPKFKVTLLLHKLLFYEYPFYTFLNPLYIHINTHNNKRAKMYSNNRL